MLLSQLRCVLQGERCDRPLFSWSAHYLCNRHALLCFVACCIPL